MLPAAGPRIARRRVIGKGSDMARRRVAVFFGGNSMEHDVSVLTGIQVMDALDAQAYEAIPVYVAQSGEWFTGDALRRRESYLPDERTEKGLKTVHLLLGRDRAQKVEGPMLVTFANRTFGGRREEQIPFDIAFPAMHGGDGENGSIQGLFRFAGIPYVGPGPLGAAATMDKIFTKRLLGGLGIPMLSAAAFDRPTSGLHVPRETIEAVLARDLAGTDFPYCVKPRQLGSSVGVGKARDIAELEAALVRCFRMDTSAMVEPHVPEVAEYNIAVTRAFGEPKVSAIERPLAQAGFLDFESKYLRGGSGGAKVPGEGGGMASADRVLNPPELSEAQAGLIRETALSAFDALQMAGCARIDYLSNPATGEIWLNEVNSIPGSLAYYLWEAPPLGIGFTELLDALIEEGMARAGADVIETDPAVGNAVIFKR